MIPTEFAAAQVPFLIYDLSDADPAKHPGVALGFYWSIPLPEDNQLQTIDVQGPLPTRQEAIDEATAFIKDALTEFPEADASTQEKTT